MKLAILGGTGIIGKELSRAASMAGHEVFVLSRGGSPTPSPIEFGGVRYIRGDAQNQHDLERFRATSEYDAVVDLLSFTPDQLSRSLEVFSPWCGQYLFASSATVYGSAPGGGRLTESSALSPSVWAYPRLKADCEVLLRERCRSQGQTFTIFRPYITYGPSRLGFGVWEIGDVFSRLLEGSPIVIGNEVADARTSVTHSYDLARGVLALLGNPGATDETFHIASGETTTWRDVFAFAADAMGVTAHIVPAPVDSILDGFPELKGKAEDRSRDRAFNNDKLHDICPEFEFKYTPELGYSEVLSGMLSRGAPDNGPRHHGRIDRLARSAASSSDVHALIQRSHGALLTANPHGYAKRLIGYHPTINRVVRSFKSGLRRPARSPYDLG